MKKHTWKIIGAVAVLAIVASVIFAQQADEKANEGIVFTPHVKGNPDASVTLTKYSDFQCPACAQAYPVVEAILEQYGDQVRFEYRHFPLVTIHPYALPAARAAEAAGQQGKFWEMHNALFDNQSVWSNSGNPQIAFIQYAEEIGLDIAQFKTQMGASRVTDKVMAEFAEAQQKSFTGTPTFELNGERIQFTSYQELIDLVGVAVGGGAAEANTTTTTGDVPSAASAEPDVTFGF